MTRDESAILVIGIAVVVALFGIALAGSSLATHRSFGGMMSGGMMNGTATTDPGPGGLEWGILAASAALFLGAMGVFFRVRSAGNRAEREPDGPPAPVRALSVIPGAPPPVRDEPVPEQALVRLLDENERRMYLEIRDHGREMLQRDLVALGTFSKAKVTRVLDKLEAKGLVVRVRHGITNRVRLVAPATK